MKRSKSVGLSTAGWPILILALFLASCDNNDPTSPVESRTDIATLAKEPPLVPPVLEVPTGNRLAFATSAEGVQIYRCDLTATGYAWVFVAPEAVLVEGNNGVVGSHYAGPTWETNSGSNVVGVKLQSSLSPDPTAIPWLLLGAVSTQGPGVLENVTYIHRVNTSGGTAPTTGCDSSHVGEEVRVPYTAEYFFYRAQG